MKKKSLRDNRFVNYIITITNRILNYTPYNETIGVISKEKLIPPDIKQEKEFLEIYEKCKKFTLTSIERMYSLYSALQYIVKNNILGDIIECGVWKGGSMMFCALFLKKNNMTDKILYLFDTYEGMSKPTNRDMRIHDSSLATVKFEKLQKRGEKWDYASLEEVQRNLFSTGYPKENLRFIKGKVEETIPKTLPKKISILRLDTDWFESTYHELIHLYPNLVQKGILILDDYGHWKGAKDAVDQYFKENKINFLLNRNDRTGRIGIKLE